MAATHAVRNDIGDVVDRLARLGPTDLPVISLYLNLQADQHGKDNFTSYVRKELIIGSFAEAADPPVRESFDRDVERIVAYVTTEIPPEANGLALFACSGLGDLFDVILLDAPIARHRVTVSSQPELYPLELALDQSPRYAVVFADSHLARLFVFGHGRLLSAEFVEGRHVRRSAGGGWSQSRFQRHVDTVQASHARELVGALNRLVRDEQVEYIVLAGDEVNVPLVKRELSNELAAKLIDVIKLEAHSSEHDIQVAAAEAVRRHDAEMDRVVVEAALGDGHAAGMATVGLVDTIRALDNGQVRELCLTVAESFGDDSSVSADDLVRRAHRTSAPIRFIEDAILLAEVEGIAATLRFRLDAWRLRKGRNHEQEHQCQSRQLQGCGARAAGRGRRPGG